MVFARTFSVVFTGGAILCMALLSLLGTLAARDIDVANIKKLTPDRYEHMKALIGEFAEKAPARLTVQSTSAPAAPETKSPTAELKAVVKPFVEPTPEPVVAVAMDAAEKVGKRSKRPRSVEEKENAELFRELPLMKSSDTKDNVPRSRRSAVMSKTGVEAKATTNGASKDLLEEEAMSPRIVSAILKKGSYTNLQLTTDLDAKPPTVASPPVPTIVNNETYDVSPPGDLKQDGLPPATPSEAGLLDTAAGPESNIAATETATGPENDAGTSSSALRGKEVTNPGESLAAEDDSDIPSTPSSSTTLPETKDADVATKKALTPVKPPRRVRFCVGGNLVEPSASASNLRAVPKGDVLPRRSALRSSSATESQVETPTALGKGDYGYTVDVSAGMGGQVHPRPCTSEHCAMADNAVDADAPIVSEPTGNAVPWYQLYDVPDSLVEVDPYDSEYYYRDPVPVPESGAGSVKYASLVFPEDHIYEEVPGGGEDEYLYMRSRPSYSENSRQSDGNSPIYENIPLIRCPDVVLPTKSAEAPEVPERRSFRNSDPVLNIRPRSARLTDKFTNGVENASSKVQSKLSTVGAYAKKKAKALKRFILGRGKEFCYAVDAVGDVIEDGVNDTRRTAAYAISKLHDKVEPSSGRYSSSGEAAY
ncbi:proteoglycan 4 [Babesia caballi]|uniref:Proteoglycan 4 n=1 Tax=Babesia caballi TaxID=5871 RepID=A0AAV4M4L8_BABCB|nr:proteoglycan 4 [Babesia caballi]